MRYYKGDIVQIYHDDKHGPLNHYHARELIGINETINVVDHYVLWYRPLKNRIKQFLHYINKKIS